LKIFNFNLLAFLGLLVLMACSNSQNAEVVLNNAILKAQTYSTFQYEFETHWDNRFNETTFGFDAQIVHSQLRSSHHGFIYDGKDYYEIDHTTQVIIKTPTSILKDDEAYFDAQIVLNATPMNIPDFDTFSHHFDTIINDQPYFIYQLFTEKPSMSDTTKTVRNEQFYFINIENEWLTSVKHISMIDTDTLQIIDYHFTNIELHKEAFDFERIDRASSQQYIETSEQDMEKSKAIALIKKGDLLKKQTYLDVDEQEVEVYGKANNKTLIMFSFIGCGGCEYALREMKNKHFDIKQGIDLMYSSPVDKASTLKSYLEKKAFKGVGFSKESKMNDDFSIWSYPTFVLVSSKGKVENVLYGYTDEVEKILFEE
jgi:thioredoxin-related protein